MWYVNIDTVSIDYKNSNSFILTMWYVNEVDAAEDKIGLLVLY